MPHASLVNSAPSLLAIGLPTGWEWIVLLVLGLLIFGRRLPEVGRSVGRSIVEFKKGIKGIEEEIETESRDGPKSRGGQLPDQVSPAAREAREQPVGVESQAGEH